MSLIHWSDKWGIYFIIAAFYQMHDNPFCPQQCDVQDVIEVSVQTEKSRHQIERERE